MATSASVSSAPPSLVVANLVTPISRQKTALNARVRSLELLAFEDGQARDGMLVARIIDLE